MAPSVIAWRPYALGTLNEGGKVYRCPCGARTKAPGLDGWWWRWTPPRDPDRHARGLVVEARCAACAASKNASGAAR